MSEAENESADTPEVKPMDIDGVGAFIVGTIIWVVILIALVIVYVASDAVPGWWVGVAGTATGVGLLGILYTTRRRSAYRKVGRMGGDGG